MDRQLVQEMLLWSEERAEGRAAGSATDGGGSFPDGTGRGEAAPAVARSR